MALALNILNVVFTILLLHMVLRFAQPWNDDVLFSTRFSKMSPFAIRSHHRRRADGGEHGTNSSAKAPLNNGGNSNAVKAVIDYRVKEFFLQADSFRCPQDRVVTMAEMAKHVTETDLWITIDGNVLDVSNFVSRHPGGAALLEAAGGTDMATVFAKFHHPSTVQLFSSFCVGRSEHQPEYSPRPGD